MNILKDLCNFISRFEHIHGQEPDFIPITDVEVWDIHEAMERAVMSVPYQNNPIAGFDTFDTPFAAEIRGKQLEVPFIKVAETERIDWMEWRVEAQSSHTAMYERLSARLMAQILGSTSSLNVTFDWDVFAGLKRFLRLTRWFPVKTKTMKIDCRVLYPYAKNPLPHNRHAIRFSTRHAENK